MEDRGGIKCADDVTGGVVPGPKKAPEGGVNASPKPEGLGLVLR
jgi:hypothetical protein